MPTQTDDYLELLKLNDVYKRLKRPQPSRYDNNRVQKPHKKDFEDAQSHIRRLVDPETPPSGLDKALFLYALEKSLVHVEGYASLSHDHVSTLVDLQDEVAKYDIFTAPKQAEDIRPLTWLIASRPGEGKSHLARCISRAPDLRHKVGLVSYNMANMRRPETVHSASSGQTGTKDKILRFKHSKRQSILRFESQQARLIFCNRLCIYYLYSYI